MSDLLKMYKALENAELGQRIQGAAVKYAHYLLSNEAADAEDAAFAQMVLDEPFRQWQDMHIEVVTNATILSALVMSLDGSVVYSGNVQDSDITYVVETQWKKFAANNLPEAVPGDSAV